VRAMGLQKVTFQELWEMQMELEPFCADLAAARISEDIADELRANLRATEENLADDAAIIRLDIQFHQLIGKAAQNAALMLSLQPIGMLLFSATVDLYQKVPPARHRLLQAHQQIAAAIIGHDREVARAWMARHISDFRRGYVVAGISLDRAIALDEQALQR
jgi:GntR family transcriptional repressor for pyruvate dehydrogenase complex